MAQYQFKPSNIQCQTISTYFVEIPTQTMINQLESTHIKNIETTYDRVE